MADTKQNSLKEIQDAYRKLTKNTDANLKDAVVSCAGFVGDRSIDDLSFDELDYIGRNFLIQHLLPLDSQNRIARNALLNSVDYLSFLRAMEGEELKKQDGYLFYLP